MKLTQEQQSKMWGMMGDIIQFPSHVKYILKVESHRNQDDAALLEFIEFCKNFLSGVKTKEDLRKLVDSSTRYSVLGEQARSFLRLMGMRKR